jgi:hypothetical protein
MVDKVKSAIFPHSGRQVKMAFVVNVCQVGEFHQLGGKLSHLSVQK